MAVEQAVKQAAKDEDRNIQRAIKEVAEALNDAAGQIELAKMRIDEVEVEFQTHVELVGGAEVSIWVIKVGGEVSWERTNTVCITLSPQPTMKVAEELGGFARQLKAALALIVEGTTNLPEGIGTKGASIEITFVLGVEGHFEVVVTGSAKKEEMHVARIKLVPVP